MRPITVMWAAMRATLGLWNQKGANSGSFLFGRMAASYRSQMMPVFLKKL